MSMLNYFAPVPVPMLFVRPIPVQLIPVPRPKVLPIRFFNDTIHVTVAKKAVHVDMWISMICRLCSSNPFRQVVVGLDTEWLPNQDPGDDHPTATLQLCVGNHCLVFQLLHADLMPRNLRTFLRDPRFVFCGVGIEDDVKKLRYFHGLHVGSTADLNDLLKLKCGAGEKNFRYMGLKKLCWAVLGKEMAKPLNVTLSAWDSAVLDADQIEYAAIDAFVSSEIALSLIHSVAKVRLS